MSLALIAAGVALVSSIIGAATSTRQANKAQDRLDERQKTLDEWYKEESSIDYLDRDEVKSTLHYLNNQNQLSNQKLENELISSGATSAQRVASASALNEEYAKNVAQIASEATAYDDALEQKYLSLNDSLAKEQYNNDIDKANATSQIINIGSSAASTINAVGGIKKTTVSMDESMLE